ncbi:MAG TPA: S46 family peptidase [Bacteroidia bacterium]|nr:S46 family peptidase [Bacteroidia bacterium]
MTKKITLALIISFVFNVAVKADEGMWLPMLLGQQVYDDMVKKGLKLTKEQLYDINKPSVKDAIIIFGGGCTGEIVSNEGLIFTNHHCGYEAIAKASSVEHNYLRDGFWAKSKAEEIPSDNLSVQFLVKIEDVTDKVNEATKGLSEADYLKKLPEILTEMGKKLTEGTTYEGRVASFFKGNQFLLFTYERFKDVRLVGTPSESVGKFGGDTDNWEWPRHTGDFSVFRVYTTKDGKAGDYAADNVPMKPKWFLPVSTKGVKDGDYAMIYGYPGGTNRYETSFGVKLKTEVENPSLVNLRDVRLKLMKEQMVKDAGVKLQLASSYARIANYWKFFDGESKQLIKYDVYGQKQKDEGDFLNWAKDKPEYLSIFQDYRKAYETWTPYAKWRVYLQEGIFGSPLIKFANDLSALDKVLSKKDATPEEIAKAVDAAKKAHDTFIKDENVASDKNILAAVTNMFYNDIPQDQQPKAFFAWMKNKYGDLNNVHSFEAYATDVFTNSILIGAPENWNYFVAKPDTAKLHKDLAFFTANAFNSFYMANYAKAFADFQAKNAWLGKTYLKGVMEEKGTKKMYPDANFTMRVSFGEVKPYHPRDGLDLASVCTMKGVLEKYKPGDYEFDLPKNFVDIARKKDFGPYIDKTHNDLVVSFITTNDITGGNSGSPVMNGKGELIGLAFDGNYEALSHKIAFDKDLNRTICVDVRYVLFVIDKVGGATNIIKELKIPQ